MDQKTRSRRLIFLAEHIFFGGLTPQSLREFGRPKPGCTFQSVIQAVHRGRQLGAMQDHDTQIHRIADELGKVIDLLEEKPGQ